ncbi:hypothetical protein [Amycolatopsis sp. NPDC051071]
MIWVVLTTQITHEPTSAITDPGGTGPLFLVFKGGSGGLFDVDAITFEEN